MTHHRCPHRRLLTAAIGLACLAFCARGARAAEPEPAVTAPVDLARIASELAGSFRVYDRPSDDGSMLIVEWARPADEVTGISYVIEVAQSEAELAAGKFKIVRTTGKPKSDEPKYFGFGARNGRYLFAEISPAALLPPAPKEIEPPKNPDGTPNERLAAYLQTQEQKRLKAERERINRLPHFFRLAVTDGQQRAHVSRDGAPVVLQASARPNLFKGYKLNNLLFAVIFCGIVLGFIHAARKNPNLFIRKIAGLDAVDEAVGRATEMGRPVYFVHGLGGVGGLATIAAVNILARVARRAAEYDTRVRVMNNDPIVTAVSQEVVKQAYTEAGRPDAYNVDDVSLVAADQFSYAAAVGGRMVREQPAAVFLVGTFAAESLLLAETGASTGAIQVAGTDSYAQLPFFVTTCDYTLIGEELFAASAYLSREPRMLGSLRGQDVGKAFLMLVMVLGTLALTIALARGADVTWFSQLFQAF